MLLKWVYWRSYLILLVSISTVFRSTSFIASLSVPPYQANLSCRVSKDDGRTCLSASQSEHDNLPSLVFDVLPEYDEKELEKESEFRANRHRRQANSASSNYRNKNKKTYPTPQQLQEEKQLYKAGFVESKRTQKRLQRIARNKNSVVKLNSSSSSLNIDYDAASSILDEILSSDHYLEVNEMNIVYALVLSAKALPNMKMGRVPSQRLAFSKKLHQVSNMLRHILDNDLSSAPRITARQLANVSWALVKHLSHISSPKLKEDIEDVLSNITRNLVNRLRIQYDDKANIDDTVNLDHRETEKSTLSPIEISMIIGSLAWLKPRIAPVGWSKGFSKTRIPSDDGSEDETSTIFYVNAGYDPSFGTVDKIPSTGENYDSSKDVYDEVFEELAKFIIKEPMSLKHYDWESLSNILWGYAHRGFRSSTCEMLASEVTLEATNRIIEIMNEMNIKSYPLPRDLSLLSWSLGVMQVDNFRLGKPFEEFINALSKYIIQNNAALDSWDSKDLVQLTSALGHGRVDDEPLLEAIYKRAQVILNDESRNNIKTWELTVLIWVIAKLDLTYDSKEIYHKFLDSSLTSILRRFRNASSGSLEDGTFTLRGIGPQEQANVCWSIAVCERYNSNVSLELLQLIYDSASCDKCIQPEHAHQLWQALFVFEKNSTEFLPKVKAEFKQWLKSQWLNEKRRRKESSARHKALSKTLSLMKIPHFNEHDDIDVAMILPNFFDHAGDTSDYPSRKESLVRHVALEFDGPSHFVRGGRRPLGETQLKYRLLKLEGWEVVKVPYQEFDKIPFWSSMERQRYLQRILKTHESIQFSEVDVSVISDIPDNRLTRFD